MAARKMTPRGKGRELLVRSCYRSVYLLLSRYLSLWRLSPVGALITIISGAFLEQ